VQPSNWEIHDALGRARVRLYQAHNPDNDAIIDELHRLESRLEWEGLAPKPSACGKRITEHGESWTDWWLWANVEIQAIVDACETDCDLLEELIGTSDGSPLAGYSPTGRPFYHAPVLHQGRYHTLVTMHGGLDV
jgi:hypothetical protein